VFGPANAQNPAVTPTFDQNVSVNLGGSVLFGAPINPGGLAGMILPGSRPFRHGYEQLYLHACHGGAVQRQQRERHHVLAQHGWRTDLQRAANELPTIQLIRTNGIGSARSLVGAQWAH